MNKFVIPVPKGIRYMLDWKEFNIPNHPCIINKQLTGCGFTEYCLRPNPKLKNVILVSPRRALLENKEKQHNNPKGDSFEEIEQLKKERGEIFYAKNESEAARNIDSDINKDKSDRVKKLNKETIQKSILDLRYSIEDYVNRTYNLDNPCKIIVTYDSFRHVKEVLGDNINDFNIIVDEMQSIFVDSRFKSDTEMELCNQLKGLQNVCYLSATPMLEEYLDMLDEFKDLPYYELDWYTEDPGRVRKPIIEAHSCNKLLVMEKSWIEKYKSGNFDKKVYIDNDGKVKEIFSKELVIYVNSVSNICTLIRSCKLSPDECNILCSKNPENLKKVKDTFKSLGYDYQELGTIPEEGEEHKMFTFCTRTVYLGADFYSTNAQTVIFSDANVECLSVDISLDLPQIMGRQRLVENPWRNEAIFYYKTKRDIKSPEEFRKYINEKRQVTENILSTYETLDEVTKKDLTEAYELTARIKKYKTNYVSVNKHEGSSPVPTFNTLVMVSEMRAFEIQNIDYQDRFTLLNTIDNSEDMDLKNKPIIEFIEKFKKLNTFPSKLKYLCEFIEGNQNLKDITLECVPVFIKNYYISLGADVCKKTMYRKSLLDKELQTLMNNQEISAAGLVYEVILLGEKYSKAHIKLTLQEIYDKCGLKRTAKATDIEEYYEIKPCKISNKETGKRDMGFEIIKRKEN